MFEIKGHIYGEGAPVLCVPIIDKKREAIVAKAVRLAVVATPMIEWRIDYCENLEDIDQMVGIAMDIYGAIGDTALLITYRSKAEGGEGIANIEYIKALYNRLSEKKACDIIDVEIYQNDEPKSFIKEIQDKGIKVIASYHNFSYTPKESELKKVLSDMKAAGADILKLAVMPQSKSDVLSLMNVTLDWSNNNKDGAPIATMSMGGLGLVSRIIGEFTGSCITFGADGVASAPGQIDKTNLDAMLTTIHRAMAAVKPNIYLIGFMGCGKSRISFELGQMTGLEVVDTDEKLVEAFGMSIPEIFEKYGEERFRLAETQLMAKLATEGGKIISCGGGVILRETNRLNMKKSGICVQLTAEPETILERVGEDTNRPLLKGHMNVPDIQAMLDAREAGYAAARDVMVSTDERDPVDIAEEIRQLII